MANQADNEKKVGTMQDDLADLMEEKNHPKGKKGIFAGKISLRRREIQRDLVDVYTDSNGEIPDLTKLDRRERPLWKTILYVLIVVFAVLLVTAATGFVVFNNLNKKVFTNENVVFKIEPPLTIVSGQQTDFTILVTNQEKVSLYNANVDIIYPDNFAYVSSSPVAMGNNNSNWEFTVLKPGETRTIKLTGTITAPIDSVSTFKGTLTFKPENLNATFNQESDVDVKIANSLINLTVAGPGNTLANQPVEYDIDYKNTSADDYANLQLVAEYPSGFVFASSSAPSFDSNNNLWTIAKLPAGAEGKLAIKGNYSAVNDSSSSQEFKVSIQLKKDDNWLTQSQALVTTNVAKDQLSLQLIVNGSAEDQPINFSDSLVYSLSYSNTGQYDLKNINISTQMNSDILDLSSISDNNKGVLKGQTITWTGKQIPQLLDLGPGQQGTITWTVKVKDPSVVNDTNVSNFSVESTAMASADQNGSNSGKSQVSSKTITNAINSNLDIQAEARYYNEDNIAVGSGPITPKAGEESTYEIKLSLVNNLHDMNNLMAVVTLPKGVTWADSESHGVGNLTYSQGSNKVTWTVSRLVKSADNTEATFKVAIKPTQDDIGKVLILVSAINLTANDSTTGSNVGKDLKAITTAFNDPTLGQQDGIVQ